MHIFLPYQAKTYREKMLTCNIEPEIQKGLEIGALHNPIIKPCHGVVRFVDYADSETVRSRLSKNPEFSDNLDLLKGAVIVDYVWSGSGSLSDIIGTGELFDWVIASHVIEHVPNILGWLRGITDVLKPGGTLNLAIPDRRFTFDVNCPESTLGQMVEADLLDYKHPSVRQVFDNCYYGTAMDPGAPWSNEVDVKKLPRFTGDIAPRLAYEQAIRIVNSGDYIDSHCWIFTPSSFLELVEGASDLGLTSLLMTAFHSTRIGDFEFFASFQRADDKLIHGDVRTAQLSTIRALRADLKDTLRKAALISGA